MLLLQKQSYKERLLFCDESLIDWWVDGMRTDRKENGAWRKIFLESKVLGSLVIVCGSALYACTLHITYTLLPFMIPSLNGHAYYSWVVTIFSIASLLGASLFRKILPSAKPRFSYILSCMIFSVGSLFCANATSIFFFLIGRFIQGFGGGLLLCLSYSLIRTVFERSLWPYGMALISGAWGISIFLGPGIGGFFSQYSSWRGAFWILFFLSILVSLIAFFLLPIRKQEDDSGPLPFAQLIILIFLVLILSVGSFIEQVKYQAVAILLASILLFFLAFIEKKSHYKILPLGSFSPDSLFFSVYIVIVFHMTAMGSIELYLPFFMQTLHKASPLTVGYFAALVSFGWTLGSVCGAGISPHKLPHLILCAPLLCLVGMVGLSFIVPYFFDASSIIPFCFIALITLGIGAGSGLIWPHLLSSILYHARPEEKSIATASIVSIQLFCGAFSAAISGMVANFSGFANISANMEMLVNISHVAKVLFLFSTGVILVSFPCLLRIALILRKS